MMELLYDKHAERKLNRTAGNHGRLRLLFALIKK